MRHPPRHNQSIPPQQRFARGADAGFAVRGEGDVGGARVAAVEGPFCFAVADYEGAGGCHCSAEGRGGGWEGIPGGGGRKAD